MLCCVWSFWSKAKLHPSPPSRTPQSRLLFHFSSLRNPMSPNDPRKPRNRDIAWPPMDWKKFKDDDDKRCSDARESLPISTKIRDEVARSVSNGKCTRPQKLYVVWCGGCKESRNSTGKRYVFVGLLKSMDWSLSKEDGWKCPECSKPPTE